MELTKLDWSIAYKILQAVCGCFLQKNYFKAIELCEHTSSANPFTFVPVCKVINCCVGPQGPLETQLIKTHPDMWSVEVTPTVGFKNWELLCNPTANFKTYWDSIQQVQHYAILHNHYSLKNTLIFGTHGWGQWLMRIGWWLQLDLHF